MLITHQLHLCLHVARFTALQAVPHAVGAEADIMPALAEKTELVALAAGFFQIADVATVFFRHAAHCSANRRAWEERGSRPMCQAAQNSPNPR